MLRYFFTWAPLAIIAAMAVIITSPVLALIAFMLVVPGALLALGWAIVAVPMKLGRAIMGTTASVEDAPPRPVEHNWPADAQDFRLAP